MSFRFAIRDDDTNYFTSPEELESAYADLPEHVPVSLAVVPFHGGTETQAIPKEHWNSDERFLVGENTELIEYLHDEIDRGNISVMLHGYDHVKTSAGPEFVAAEQLANRIRKGRVYLERLFDEEVNIFVPPNNSLSRRGLDAIKKEEMLTFYYPTPLNRPKTPEVLATTLKDLQFKYEHMDGGILSFLKHANRFWRKKDRSVFMPVYPWTYELRGVKEFTCVSMTRTDQIEQIKHQLKIADEHEGNFCLALHYHSFRSDDFRKRFYELIEYAQRELDPEFVPVDSIFGPANENWGEKATQHSGGAPSD